ncbi:MAG: hypothetical protein J6C06_02900 [Lachnospiraceae bacterium]|nr:hypothetical protein [Lachnospiraceae bacterium]
MKKIKYFFPFLFLFIFFFSLTVNAEDKPLSYATVDITNGETFYYYFEWQNGTEYQYQLADEMVYTGSKKLALYFGDGDHPMWIRSNDTNVSIPSFRSYTSMETCTSYGSWPIGNGTALTTLVPGKFETNIPLFESADLATQYSNGTIGIEKALNYKKIYENGSWVRPFEDIEINDNDMLIPSLSNLSHNGFSISNRAEEYGVDVYVVSGLRQPGEFIHDVDLDLSDYLYGHTLGWLTNGDKVYTQDSFDLIKDFGVDNVTLLNESVNSFYTEYPNARAYYPDANFMTKVYYDVWGAPFGTTYFSYNDVTKVSASDLMGVDCYDVPLCFTCYKVRFYYYDENDGMHYGPWAVVTYCSNGDIKASTSYVGNDGSVIDTPTDFGKQDEQGNISYDNNNYSEFIDLGDVNGLFGNIRSIFNNISATNGTFSQLFASVFNFLPPEILAIIFGGIVLMVFIGIIKACIG